MARGHLNTKRADFHLTFYVLVPSPHPHQHLESLDPSLEGAVTSPVKRERGFWQPRLRFPSAGSGFPSQTCHVSSSSLRFLGLSPLPLVFMG